MKIGVNFFRLLLIPLTIAITGCSSLTNLTLASPKVLTISQAKEREFIEQTFYVEGEVEKVIPFLNSYMYSLRNGKDLIWVESNNRRTEKEFIKIEAILKQKIMMIDGEEYTDFYLQETNR